MPLCRMPRENHEQPRTLAGAGPIWKREFRDSYMHALFRESMLAHMAGTMGKFEATRAIPHTLVKGLAREALASGVLRPWFGSSIAIGTGIIIDNCGHESRQCDNVLFWPDVQPHISMGGDSGPSLFPIEGVASVVEVKSTLTTSELSKALENLESCHALRMGSGAAMTSTGHKAPHSTKRLFRCILAFQSEVATQTLLQTLKMTRAWDAACVLGPNGGLFFVAATGEPSQFLVESDPERLMGFSVILRDNIQDVRATRGTPALFSYVTDMKPQPF